MNLMADEGVDCPIVERLRQDGYQVWYVAEMDPGLDDDEILNQANEGAAILITSDKGFGELVYRQRRINSGVILLRLSGLSSDHKSSIVIQALREHQQELFNAFTVISPGMIRIRSSN